MTNAIPFPVEPVGPGVLRARLDDVWTAARKWATVHGHEHDYSNVQGIAPL